MKPTSLFLFLLLITLSACSTQSTSTHVKQPSTQSVTKIEYSTDFEKIEKSDDEWKSELTGEQFYILRQKGTEPAGTSELLSNKSEGVYVCAGCQLPLFKSDTKFKSGTGWPSFYDAISDKHVTTEKDVSYGMVREEILCGRCDGHLGHVFDDGPNPTGLRYCVNGLSLDFVPKTDNEE